jgi:ATP-dependent helicase/nuclease subunit A
LLVRPVGELLAERLRLLGFEGQTRARRVLEAVESAPALRAALPNATLGTWLEQVWLRLGGADCVDATARANLDLLWNILDSLPNGEQDLLAPTLDQALERLTAMPDPEASSDYGVQLMTIHKSKGLEFETVIVPEIQARRKQGQRRLLSWLERGLAEPDEHGEITEFLVAPLQSKGAQRSAAKAWVDRMILEREKQEDRRILYVAATRARGELHLFAQPAYRAAHDGSLTLCPPKTSLLATAWPALEDTARERFEAWKAARAISTPEPSIVEAIAAEAAVTPLAKPTILHRLPGDYKPPQTTSRDISAFSRTPGARLYERHEGGMLTRAFGIAVHRYMEELARKNANHDREDAQSTLEKLAPSIISRLRALGIDKSSAREIGLDALAIVAKALKDPVCLWILSPHADAASEVRWVGVMDGELQTVQADRVFRAGAAPRSPGAHTWWIVDFKTAQIGIANAGDAAAKLRPLFAQQLEAYAAVLRNLRREDAAICAGLYYPRAMMFDWWEIKSQLELPFAP